VKQKLCSACYDKQSCASKQKVISCAVKHVVLATEETLGADDWHKEPHFLKFLILNERIISNQQSKGADQVRNN
jgi:hypothetical protein